MKSSPLFAILALALAAGAAPRTDLLPAAGRSVPMRRSLIGVNHLAYGKEDTVCCSPAHTRTTLC